MWPIPKFEFEWEEPKEFRQAQALCIDRTYGKHWKIWASLGTGFGFAYLATFGLWLKLIVPGNLLAKISTTRSVEGIAIAFLFGNAICWFCIWAELHLKMPYYVSAKRILKGDLRFKLPFRNMNRCIVYDFTEFLLLEFEMTGKFPDAICAVSGKDFETLHRILATREIPIETTSKVFRWSEQAAIQEFERIRFDRHIKAKGRIGNRAPVHEVRSPSVRELMTAVLIVGTVLGFTLRQSEHCGELFRIIEGQKARYDEMTNEASVAKAEAGEKWTSLRGEYVARLDVQIDATNASVNRFVYDLILTVILGFGTFFLVIYVGLCLIFHPVRKIRPNDPDPSEPGVRSH